MVGSQPTLVEERRLDLADRGNSTFWRAGEKIDAASVGLHPNPPRKMSLEAVPSYPTDQSDKSTDPITSTLVSSHHSSSLPSLDSAGDDDDSDDDSDSSDSETTERLRDLFLKAKASAREKAACAKEPPQKKPAKAPAPAGGDSLAGQDEVVLFGGDDSEDDEEDGADGGSVPCAP